MKTELDNKKKEIIFKPESTIDAFNLGKIFGDGNIDYTMEAINGEVTKIIIRTNDLYRYLLFGQALLREQKDKNEQLVKNL